MPHEANVKYYYKNSEHIKHKEKEGVSLTEGVSVAQRDSTAGCVNKGGKPAGWKTQFIPSRKVGRGAKKTHQKENRTLFLISAEEKVMLAVLKMFMLAERPFPHSSAWNVSEWLYICCYFLDL